MHPTHEQLLAKVDALPERPMAIEASWDGDSSGWFVCLTAILKTDTGYRDGHLWVLQDGGDLRLFNGQVPPWGEAVLARQLGEELAAKFGVPFYFPSPITLKPIVRAGGSRIRVTRAGGAASRCSNEAIHARGGASATTATSTRSGRRRRLGGRPRSGPGRGATSAATRRRGRWAIPSHARPVWTVTRTTSARAAAPSAS